MKALTMFIALFAAVAVASPATVDEAPVALGKKRGCGASCSCQNKKCVCITCRGSACSWAPSGKKC